MKSIIDFFKTENLDIPEIGILDIGAMLTDGHSKEYQPLLDAGIAKVIGFEPVEKECQKLNKDLKSKNISFLPYFIGDGTKQTFCLNNSSMTSSLLEANIELLSLFSGLAELCHTVSREEVQTTCLDDIPEIDFPIDFIKIDIQGAELQAFKHGAKLLSNTTVIQTEVEWIPLYQNQPLFSEIELHLREREFLLHRIVGFGSRAFKPVVLNNDPTSGIQYLWSDVIFVKDFTKLGQLTDRQLSVYAILMHEVYKAPDLTALVMTELGNRTESQLGQAYLQWLGEK